MTRRRYLGISAAAMVGCSARARAAGGAEAVAEFMEKFGVPGLSIAIAKDGQIVRREAFGYSDLDKGEKLNSAHRFRIASVSKPITSTAVFLLRDSGKLDLDDMVFGSDGALGRPGPGGITVRHLLTHTSGAWENDSRDPMFKRVELDHAALIDWTLENLPPKNAPGQKYAYSNFGYCLLGRIIEKLSGRSYGAFVREKVLKPRGAQGMEIGSGEREVRYYMNGKPLASKMNVARMDAHGGWVGTPGEMIEFALGVDGFAEPADLLKKESLEEMTARGGVNENYACGWSVNKVGNYWHGGSLPGLSSLLVRTAGGYCWAACANTRARGIGLALDRLMWKLSRA